MDVLATVTSAPAATSQAAGGFWEWLLTVLNNYAPLLQALFTLLLVGVTTVYVVFTRRLASIPWELHKQAVLERHEWAIKALAAEADAVSGLCDFNDQIQRPVYLPGRMWESMFPELLAQELKMEDRSVSDAGAEFYVQVRRCNGLYEAWKPFAAELDRSGRPLGGHPSGVLVCLWVKERDKLAGLLTEYSRAMREGGKARAESVDQA